MSNSDRTFLARDTVHYTLYAITIFVSSFLVFQVQPLIGKHILPWFGGSASVWVTALFFFMIALAIGYGYALVLSWFSRALQLCIHTVVVLASLGWLYQHAGVWSSAITPTLGTVPVVSADPAWQVFFVLTLSIGLPFALLSATSTLLQYWYGVRSGKEPFSLYSISNAGSLLGLLSYPFVFEPLLSTAGQGQLWFYGFVFYVALMFAVMVLYARGTTAVPAASRLDAEGSVTTRRFLTWVGVASVPIIAMLTGTNFVLGYVAAMPFLWVVPLALYLFSFVLAFTERVHIKPLYLQLAVVASSLITLTITLSPSAPILTTLLAVWVTIFAIAHWCHEWLYANRPTISGVPLFYVSLSLGGILASGSVLFVTTVLLPVPVEFIILLIVSSSVAGVFLFRFGKTIFVGKLNYALQFMAALCVVTFASFGYGMWEDLQGTLVAERNFFGPKTVTERVSEDHGLRRTLTHGVTNHGYQFMNGELDSIPVSYYSETAGVYQAFQAMREERGEAGISVAIAGLGSGALNAHCGPNDRFTFYEIDPEVIDIANEHFTYLANCPGTTVVEGDARLRLAEEHQAGDREKYDLIILDAYADDSMPIHLMTADAIALYKELLRPDGMLAVHISSRYLELGPVMVGNAAENDLALRYRYDGNPPEYASQSYWTVLAHSEEAFDGLEGLLEFKNIDPVVWTDTYSALWPVVKR